MGDVTIRPAAPGPKRVFHFFGYGLAAEQYFKISDFWIGNWSLKICYWLFSIVSSAESFPNANAPETQIATAEIKAISFWPFPFGGENPF
jgi:hypothetical protein